MASIIRIKRSSGTSKPASLQWGEMAYVTGIGSYGGVNQYKDRVWIGDDGTNSIPVGGHYYTSMMEHTPGSITGVTNTRNSDGGIVAVLDSNRKVDEWNVDNLTLNANTLSSSNTNGEIILDANGTGEVLIPDDSFFTFGTDKNAKIEYDENGTDRVQVTGAPWTFNSEVQFSGAFTVDQVEIRDNIISTKSGSGIFYILTHIQTV